MANERATKMVEIARQKNFMSSIKPIENSTQIRNGRILNWIQNVTEAKTSSKSYNLINIFE